MRKFLILLAFVSVLLMGPANADINGTSPHDYIASAIDSVCRIEIYKGDNKVGSGSGFVVEQTEEVTKIITARHVVESATKLGIILHGKEYFSSKFFAADSTDAAMIFVEPTIPHAKALQFNLDPSDAIIKANAFGFWGRSRIPGTAQMVTMTSGWVDRKVVDKYSAPDYQVIRGMIFSNVLIFPGYSGGPLLDNNMRVVGVNVILSPRHTIFVDSRYLWNAIANLNKGRKVKVPYDYEYDVLNTGAHKRVSSAINDVIRNVDKDDNITDTTLGDLQDLISQDIRDNGRPAYPPEFQTTPDEKILNLFRTSTMIVMGDKKYLVASVAIMALGLRKAGRETPHPSCFKYIYLVQHGAEIIIELAELPKEGETLKVVTKKGAFFRNLNGRHFR